MNQRRQISKLAVLAVTAISAIVLLTESSDDPVAVADFDPRGLRPVSSQQEKNYCSEAGSLNQIALDMINSSSPPGSPSYLKLKHILQSNQQFYISLPAKHGLFAAVENGVTQMLEGSGLQRVAETDPQDAHITLVEGILRESKCPITEAQCQNRPRILVQSEQLGGMIERALPKIELCHTSPNCVILEFSDYNRSVYGAMISKDPEGNGTPYKDSIVLVPVMTQSPSRLSGLEPPTPRQLTKEERSKDIVFLGGTNPRRRQFRKQKFRRKGHSYEKIMTMEPSKKGQAEYYKDAKVCLVLHSYDGKSGGEYHRLSEFGPFGCIPVMEKFGDSIGIEAFETCGGAMFAPLDNLMEVAVSVVGQVHKGVYQGRTSQEMVDWWRAGIQWGSLLESVYDDAPFHSSS